MSENAITLTDITSPRWSLALDGSFGDGSGIGHVVQGVDDVAQCIRIILTTPKRSDPLRPTFGCDLFKYIDQPINSALPAIIREVIDALTAWEPAIDPDSIVVTATPTGSDYSHLDITVGWQLDLGGASSEPQITEVRI